MDVKYSKFYQLGNAGDLIFERDLDQLSELLERSHPEFFGAQLNDQGGEDLQWLIVASLRGKIEPPTPRNVVVKVYNLCRVSNYSNSRVYGYGQLEWPYCSPVRLFKMTCERPETLT